jgi:hypothetical protein
VPNRKTFLLFVCCWLLTNERQQYPIELSCHRQAPRQAPRWPKHRRSHRRRQRPTRHNTRTSQSNNGRGVVARRQIDRYLGQNDAFVLFRLLVRLGQSVGVEFRLTQRLHFANENVFQRVDRLTLLLDLFADRFRNTIDIKERRRGC